MTKVIAALKAAIDVVAHRPVVRKASAAADAAFIAALIAGVTDNGFQFSDVEAAFSVALVAGVTVFRAKANRVAR